MLFVIALLAGLATFYIIGAYLGGRRYGRPARIGISFANPEERGLAYEEVMIPSADGVKLAGWYIPSRNRAAVLLLHGYSGNRLAVMFHAEALAKAGFGILMIDLRAHGASGGSGTFGRTELMISDARAAISYLQDREDVDRERLGVLGVSVGGTMALQAAARLLAIRAVAVDGAGPAAYADLVPARNWWDWLFLPVNQLFFRSAARAATAQPLPPNKDVAGKIAPRPLLLIAAGRGGERHLAQQYYEAAQEPKEFWNIDDVPHGGGWIKHADQYAVRITAFFTNALVHESGEVTSATDSV